MTTSMRADCWAWSARFSAAAVALDCSVAFRGAIFSARAAARWLLNEARVVSLMLGLSMIWRNCSVLGDGGFVEECLQLLLGVGDVVPGFVGCGGE
jgi:hypothetical protein